MDTFYKLAAILFVFCVIAIICGMITTAEKEGDFHNCTPVTLTIGEDHNTSNVKEVPVTEPEPETKKVCEKDNTTEQATDDMQPVELTDGSTEGEGEGLNDTVKEQMQEKELEQINNESDDPLIDITDGSTSQEVSTDKLGSGELDITTGAESSVKDTPAKEQSNPTILKKTVNNSGFVFIGTKYAGEEVEIRVK